MHIATTTARAAIAAATLAACHAASADHAWSFDASTQGWSIADLSCGGSYASVLGRYAATWTATGGNPGGFILAADPSTHCYFFDAPADLVSVLPQYRGGTLGFSLQTTHNNWLSDRVVAVVGPSSLVLVAVISPTPTAQWQSYSVPLSAASFRRGTMSGPVATASEFESVFSAPVALRISAEYGADIQETVGLDSVTLTSPCGTGDFDGDGDFGTDADIEAFFSCLAGNCCATCWPAGADFNGDGDIGTDSDIEAFFRVLGGSPC